MKVVFLDIDGVLNCSRTAVALGGIKHSTHPDAIKSLDPVAIGLIRNIVQAADARVVLSSSWRISRAWQELGKQLDLPMIGSTASHSIKGHGRGHEISDWLMVHVECTHYAIVDDDRDMLPQQMPYFVHTSGDDGFTWANACRLAAILGVSPWDRISCPPKGEIFHPVAMGFMEMQKGGGLI